MNSQYGVRRPWADKFIAQAKVILGPHTIEADESIDIREATDLIVWDKLYVAFRMRKNKYFIQYPNDFTLRSQIGTRSVTEFEKIMYGHGDMLLYGFSDRKAKEIIKWTLIDLDVFRDAYIHRDTTKVKSHDINNHDGTWFKAFEIGSFPSNLVIETWTKVYE